MPTTGIVGIDTNKGRRLFGPWHQTRQLAQATIDMLGLEGHRF